MKKQLSTRFAVAMLFPVLIIFLLYAFLITRVIRIHEERTLSYGQSVVDNISLNVEITLESMKNTAKTFAYNTTVQAMARKDIMPTRVPLNSMLDMARSYNQNLLDVMITDLGAESHSLIGYHSSSVETQVKKLAKEYYLSDSAPQFTVFESDRKDYSYLLYFSPIFSIQSGSHYAQKVGTLTVMCRDDVFSRAFDSSPDMYFELLNADSNAVLLHSNLSKWKDFMPKENNYPTFTKKIPESTLILSAISTENSQDSDSMLMGFFLILSLILVLLILIYISFVVNKLFLSPIQELNEEISHLTRQGGVSRIRQISDNEIRSIGWHINKLLDTIDRLNRDIEQSCKRLYQMELAKKKTQLYAYQSQINPHFLYNMLQTMRGIALTHGVQEIADMSTNMAHIFRYSIKGEGLVTLDKELAITNMYLAMLKLRFQGSIDYLIDVPEIYNNCLIPKLSFQPLIENAVFHGLAPLFYKGKIRIYTSKENDTIRLHIYNNGAGIPKNIFEQLQKELNSPINNDFLEEDNQQIGILNVHNKIRLYTNMKYGVTLNSQPNNTIITINLPLSTDEFQEDEVKDFF